MELRTSRSFEPSLPMDWASWVLLFVPSPTPKWDFPPLLAKLKGPTNQLQLDVACPHLGQPLCLGLFNTSKRLSGSIGFNTGHWTEDMRDEALEPAELYDARLKVVDVGGGNGFTTLGIIKHVYPKNVTILDQSPHQLEKAKQKEALKECTIIEGDAEDLPIYY